MIVRCSPGEGWRLVEPADFKTFKIVLAGLAPDDTPPLAGLAFATDPAGRHHAWIRPDLPGRLAGETADEAWRASFDRMLAFAARHGWVRKDGAVRAHVERLA